MTVKYAKQIFSVGGNQRLLNLGEHAQGRDSNGSVMFFLSSTDDAGYANIGTQDFSSTAADTIVLGQVGAGFTKDIKAHGSSGAIRIDSIEYFTSVTLPNHDSIVVKAYRNLTPTAGSQWAAVSAFIATSTTTLRTVTYLTSTSSTATQSGTFHTISLGAVHASSDAASYSLKSDVDCVLRGGDLLCLHGDGAGDLTAGVAKINVIIHYTRLTQGAKIQGLGEVVA